MYSGVTLSQGLLVYGIVLAFQLLIITLALLYYYLVQLPVAEQLEQALRNLQLSTRSISDLKNQAERADEHANRLERALNRTQNELLRRDQEFSELRLQVRVLELDATRPREETDSGEAEAQRALRVARETIGELRVRSELWPSSSYL